MLIRVAGLCHDRCQPSVLAMFGMGLCLFGSMRERSIFGGRRRWKMGRHGGIREHQSLIAIVMAATGVKCLYCTYSLVIHYSPQSTSIQVQPRKQVAISWSIV